MRRLLFLPPLVLFLSACGDTGEDGPTTAGTSGKGGGGAAAAGGSGGAVGGTAGTSTGGGGSGGSGGSTAGTSTGGGGSSGNGGSTAGTGGMPVPEASCDPTDAGGSEDVAAPELVQTLFDRWHEAWLASPSVADLNGDGTVNGFDLAMLLAAWGRH